mmetsp:Transcript_29492/g.64959  ORF Transcript_29492/g.64959 Transcript_29492/m.64959 type:complete len:86 (-) Transcript_29492:52-309(-)
MLKFANLESISPKREGRLVQARASTLEKYIKTSTIRTRKETGSDAKYYVDCGWKGSQETSWFTISLNTCRNILFNVPANGRDTMH